MKFFSRLICSFVALAALASVAATLPELFNERLKSVVAVMLFKGPRRTRLLMTRSHWMRARSWSPLK